ncbi:phage holin, LLH family [Paenibacillus sp. FSL R10-2796]|uniref:phage holin, LLH family n=1 Tax=unclassified Paenibacillus TaxID=185978 RepID=UPI0030DD1C83
MQPIIDQAQPYITAVALAIVGVLATVILRAVALLQQKANSWFDAKLSVSQRELLHKITTEAVAYAETLFRQADGEKKLGNAILYVEEQLDKKGISFSSVEITSAIEHAYLSYAKNK